MSSDALNGTGRATPHDAASTSTRAHPSRRAPRRLTKPNARPSDRRRNRERVAPEELARLRMRIARAFPGKSVELARRLAGGFANANYEVLVSGMKEPVVVRVYARDPVAAEREAVVMRLVQREVPVPRVLHVEPGDDQLTAFAVLSWVEGVTLDELLRELDPPSMMRAVHAVGRVLAVLQKFRLPDTVGPVRPDGVLGNRPEHSLVSFAEEWLSGRYGQERLGVRLAGRLRQFIQHHAEALSEVEQQSMLVHGDFNPLNVIMQPVDGTAKVCALIDWEYAHSGSPLLDLGSMLRCGRDQSDQFEAALVAGYAENGGILPPDWQDVSRALDVMNLCGFLQSRRAGEIARRGVRAIVEATLTGRRRP